MTISANVNTRQRHNVGSKHNGQDNRRKAQSRWPGVGEDGVQSHHGRSDGTQEEAY